MPNLGFPELLMILLVGLLLFGAGRIPEVARALGSAVNEFKKGMSGDDQPVARTRKRKVS